MLELWELRRILDFEVVLGPSTPLLTNRTATVIGSSVEPVAPKARQITIDQRQRFIATVKRLSLQGKTIGIRSEIPDSETSDYWHSLVELFGLGGMVADGVREQFPQYDPSGLVLVVGEPTAVRLIGYARTIFDLLTVAQIDFTLGFDGIPRKPEGWCYLYVGRRLGRANESCN
jgi:hypothetical protein